MAEIAAHRSGEQTPGVVDAFVARVAAHRKHYSEKLAGFARSTTLQR